MGGLNILVVGDEPRASELQRAITGMGNNSRVAESARAALDALQNARDSPLDAVLLAPASIRADELAALRAAAVTRDITFARLGPPGESARAPDDDGRDDLVADASQADDEIARRITRAALARKEKQSHARDAVKSALDGLRRKYAARLPDKLQQLDQHFDGARQGAPGAIDEAIQVAHKLSGTAGTYGFVHVGTLAGEVELALIAWQQHPGDGRKLAAAAASIGALREHASALKT